MANYTGTTAYDNYTGTSSADTFDMSQGGIDTVSAGGGNDVIIMGGSFTNNDRLDGGANSDTLVLNGNYAKRVDMFANTIVSIETLKVTAGFSYYLKTDDGNVASGASLTIDGSTLGVSDRLFFDGSKELDGSFTMFGGAGDDKFWGGARNDVISGAGGNDHFTLDTGGNDTATGGDGDDLFSMGAALTSADKIDGGVGTNDLVALNGDYANLIFNATTMVNVEQLLLKTGHSYHLTTNNATVASGATLTVDGSALLAGQILNFNGVAELDGSFAITAGAGDDTITTGAGADHIDFRNGGIDHASGGGGDDRFDFGSTFTSADSIDGGAGTDTVTIKGNYAGGLHFGTEFTDVERIELLPGYSYVVTTDNATVASGKTLEIDASDLVSGKTLTFDGSAETDGSLTIIGGASNDHITGGAKGDTINLSEGGKDTAFGGSGNDTFIMGSALTILDKIDGGTGNDRLSISGDYAGAPVVLGATTMVNVEQLLIRSINTSLTTNDATVAPGATLSVTADKAVYFDGSAETDGTFNITGSLQNDTLIGGHGKDIFNAGNGDDTVHGGDGNDTINSGGGDDTVDGGSGNDIINPGDGNDTVDGGDGNDTINFDDNGSVTALFGGSDHVDGGTGNDTLTIAGSHYAFGVVFGAETMTNVETLSFAPASSGFDDAYKVTMNDGNVAAGQVLTVITGDKASLNFNGSAELDGRFDITGSSESDTLVGGAGDDLIDAGRGANNQITGGGGADILGGSGDNDHFIYHSASESTGVAHDIVLGLSRHPSDPEHDIRAAKDAIDLPFNVYVIDAAVSHSLSTATFDSDMAIIAANLGAHHAMGFKPSGGDYGTHGFIVVDFNGVAGYQAGQDLVIEVTTPVNLTTAYFV